MDLIEVILLNYRYKFRRLFWKEEFEMQPNGRDERRVMLATALVEVSGLKIKSFDEAWKVLSPEVLPTPILHRVFLIYKGKQPDTRTYTTMSLYRAPETSAYGQKLDEEAAIVGTEADAATKRMEEQFGKKELAEAAEVDRQILAGALNKDPKTKDSHKFRGAMPKIEDEDTAPLGGFKVRPNA